jgi:hypothetical protein
VRGLPAMQLDGEINCGRDGKRGKASFAVASNAVRLGGKWFNEVSPITGTPINFAVFDAPEVPGTWRQRMAEASRAVKKCACAAAVEFQRVRMGLPSQLRAGEISLTTVCKKPSTASSIVCPFNLADDSANTDTAASSETRRPVTR